MLFLRLTRYRNHSFLKQKKTIYKALLFSLIIWLYIAVAVLVATLHSEQKAKFIYFLGGGGSGDLLSESKPLLYRVMKPWIQAVDWAAGGRTLTKIQHNCDC